MTFNAKDQDFLEKLARSESGRDMVRVLQNIEHFYADIRNLKGVTAEIRVEALKLLKEALLDKLLILSGEIQAPEPNEFR